MEWMGNSTITVSCCSNPKEDLIVSDRVREEQRQPYRRRKKNIQRLREYVCTKSGQAGRHDRRGENGREREKRRKWNESSDDQRKVGYSAMRDKKCVRKTNYTNKVEEIMRMQGHTLYSVAPFLLQILCPSMKTSHYLISSSQFV